ncbi:YkvA family protein [Dyadobacter sediminis]|nr:YkvA family protein [Dyadobacter sediminis]GGC08484.1 hypothetical protein GCM10011325_39260 [Dyadobacter sediminis]
MSNESMIARVLKSIFFKKAQGKASRYATNSAKMFELAKQVISKMQKVGFRENMSDFQTNVQILIRMIRAYASGEYKGLPWKSILSIVAVLIYFVSPIDLIPDFLPVIGITDDVALVVWLIKTFGSDIQKFSEWEKRKKTINIG